jgi:hypothetical protein
LPLRARIRPRSATPHAQTYMYISLTLTASPPSRSSCDLSSTAISESKFHKKKHWKTNFLMQQPKTQYNNRRRNTELRTKLSVMISNNKYERCSISPIQLQNSGLECQSSRRSIITPLEELLRSISFRARHKRNPHTRNHQPATMHSLRRPELPRYATKSSNTTTETTTRRRGRGRERESTCSEWLCNRFNRCDAAAAPKLRKQKSPECGHQFVDLADSKSTRTGWMFNTVTASKYDIVYHERTLYDLKSRSFVDEIGFGRQVSRCFLRFG